MALRRSKEIPSDAVVMDETEATTYVWDIVTNWEKSSETWALRFAPAALGAINAVSGVMLNKFYRDKFKLGTYGYLSSIIPISVMPGLMTALFHRHIVSTGMLLMKADACPLCYEMRAAAIQTLFGIVYPMILAPTSALMFANRYSTYRVPSLTEGPKTMLNFLRSKSRHLGSMLMLLSATQLVASSTLTYFEMRNNLTVRARMLQAEQELAAEGGLPN